MPPIAANPFDLKCPYLSTVKYIITTICKHQKIRNNIVFRVYLKSFFIHFKYIKRKLNPLKRFINSRTERGRYAYGLISDSESIKEKIYN